MSVVRTEKAPELEFTQQHHANPCSGELQGRRITVRAAQEDFHAGAEGIGKTCDAILTIIAVIFFATLATTVLGFSLAIAGVINYVTALAIAGAPAVASVAIIGITLLIGTVCC